MGCSDSETDSEAFSTFISAVGHGWMPERLATENVR